VRPALPDPPDPPDPPALPDLPDLPDLGFMKYAYLAAKWGVIAYLAYYLAKKPAKKSPT